jgi:hypothetical protein
MGALFTASAYEALEEGVYAAELISIDKGTSESYGDFLRWNFSVTLSDGTLAPVTAASSASTGPKSKAYKWATALLGHAPVAGQPEELAGKKAQLHLIINDDGFNRVESVLPAAKATARRGPAPVVAEASADNTDPQDAALPF